MKYKFIWIIILLVCSKVVSADSLPALTITNAVGEKSSISVSLQIIALMTALTIIPALVLTMTSFTRVIIVLGILRQAIGMPQTPNNQILIGLSLFLTFYIMSPVFNELNKVAISPYLNGDIEAKEAIEHASLPIKKFMISQTRKVDISVIQDIANGADDTDDKLQEQDSVDTANIEKMPFSVLIPAFVTSELKTGFQIGFLLFVPFLVIDLVVASVLMAMGMMMLSPLIISLPFKLMLFILVDGWSLVISTLAASFGI